MARSYVDVASDAFRSTLRDLGLDDESDTDVDPADLGRRAALQAAADAVWRRAIGPMFEVDDVKHLLGVGSRQAVHDLRKRNRLLGMKRSDGRVVYPAFQFGSDGRPLPGLADVTGELAPVVDSEWTIASWLVSPQDVLGSRTPAQWLREGRGVETVVLAARRTAAHLR